MVNVGILGATGMVGQRFIQLLDNHPDFEITALAASSRSAGKKYVDATTWYLDDAMPDSVKDIVVCETNPEDMDNDVDIVFSSLPTEFAESVERDFAKDYVVASNASANRMKKNIPLVIPEVNPQFLDMIEVQQRENNWDGFIVTNPNCSTIALTLTLKPIVDYFNVKSIRVSTMQAISGAGYNGVPSMAIIDNLVPYIGSEEEKMESETLHLLGEYDPASPVIVREEADRPQPRMDRNAGNGMSVTVGRLRKEQSFDNSFKYVLVGHNTVRGAAGASVLNAELINERIL